MCAHRLDDGPLVCTRTDRHDEQARGGHTYAGSWAPDAHDRSEARDE